MRWTDRIAPALIIAISGAAYATDIDPQVFERCRLSVSVDTEWMIETAPSQENGCEIVFRHHSDGHLVNVRVVSEFLAHAYDLGFDFYNGEWVATGRQGTYRPAEIVDLENWTGLIGETSVGIHDDAGLSGIRIETSAILRERQVLQGMSIVAVSASTKRKEILRLLDAVSPSF